jgi:hypothetical protein
MKIALLNDFKEYAGAEESIKSRLECVPSNITADFKLPDDVLVYEDYDAFILENVTRFTQEQLKPIIEKRPYIKVEHDYGYCSQRNLINCRGCDLPCPAVVIPLMKEMYEKARVVISQSPAHMKTQQVHLSGWKVRHACMLMISYKNVPTPKVERKPKSIAYLGTMRAYKGIYDIITLASRNPKYQFDFAGRIGYVKPPFPPNVKVIGPVEDKWTYLAEHEYVIQVPHMLDPCPAVVTEGILMGCKIIYNQNVGNISYPYRTREEWTKALENAGPNFWRKVSSIFNEV